MPFGPIIINIIQSAISSLFKINERLNQLISEFDGECPNKDRLNQIISIKEELSNGLTQVNSKINNLNNLVGIINPILSGASAGVIGIKTIPAPTSAPPGIGIPIGIITTLSDALDSLNIIISQNKASLDSISPSLQIINGRLSNTQILLTQLDNLILRCLGQESTSQIQNTNPTSVNNINEILNERLKPNSNDPITYKGYIFEIQFDPSNQFSFPRRRIKAYLVNNKQVFILGGYSYSASTTILIEEMKFKIDQQQN